MKKSTIINDLFQKVDTFIIDKTIDCDIQPSTFEIIKKTFGEDTKSLFIIFCDEDINLNSIIEFNSQLYKVDKKVDWIEYKIYSLVDHK
ncbi:hypothetical protein QOZ92_002747 [Paeniclostridium ghonii]|uniref:Uncharacterized protein n=2 Tax=Paraclostridium ghonii TaxID=29358 RepID=A0ABU0N375_9FIRM|nr:hypothetical protein [Paeniclostridium ghonii]